MSESQEPLAARIKSPEFWRESSTWRGVIAVVGSIGIVVTAVQGNYQAAAVITGGMSAMIGMINFTRAPTQ